MAVQVWWSDRKVKAEITLWQGEEVVVGEDGTEEKKQITNKVPVIFTVDAPTGMDGMKLRRCHFASQIFTQQISMALQGMTTKILGKYQKMQSDGRAIAAKAASVMAKAYGPNATEEDRAEAADFEVEATERVNSIDFLEFSAAEEYIRVEEFSAKHEIIIEDALSLIIKYVKDIRVDVGENGTGDPVEFNGLPWAKMEVEDKMKTARRMQSEFLNPLMDVMARGVEEDVLKK